MSTTVEEATEHNPFSALGDALESAADAIGDATSDARASAKIAAKKVQSTVGAGVYKTAYGLSYGIVFSTVFLTELLPENSSLRRGFEDGAADAREAVATRKIQTLSQAHHDDHEEAVTGKE